MALAVPRLAIGFLPDPKPLSFRLRARPQKYSARAIAPDYELQSSLHDQRSHLLPADPDIAHREGARD